MSAETAAQTPPAETPKSIVRKPKGDVKAELATIVFVKPLLVSGVNYGRATTERRDMNSSTLRATKIALTSIGVEMWVDIAKQGLNGAGPTAERYLWVPQANCTHGE